MQVAGCRLQVAGYRLQVTGYRLQVATLKLATCNLQLATYNLKTYNLQLETCKKMTFSEFNLNTPLWNALEELGFENSTPIQEKAFSVIMSGKDVVGIAQTGTGKTFAYLLPLLRQLTFSKKKHPRILIVVPTRELVIQVVDEAKKLTKYINTRVAGVYGGTNINTQKQLVYDGVDILVATPGRLVDLTLSGVLRLKTIQKLVIDEVDEMLNLGFRSVLINLMDTLPFRRQNLMFSATLTTEVDGIIKNYFHEPQKIEVAAHGTPLKKIIQKAYHVPNFFTKVNLLEYLLSNDEEMKKVLVFASTKKLSDKLHEKLTLKFDDKIGVIHSNKSQNYRINSIKRFESGENRVLIATDLISRGLDITGITHVINFDTPEIPADYIHRIGRTGRAEKDGTAIVFINEVEQEFQLAIEKLMNKQIPVAILPKDLEISDVFTKEEKPLLFDKEYLKPTNIKKIIKQSKGAFHEKNEKNSQINSGSPSKKRKKYKKPISRGGKQRTKK